MSDANLSSPSSSGDEFSSRIDFSALSQAVAEVRSEIGRIIVGQTELVDALIAALLANGHVLIEGVPGVAKTLTAKLLAQVVDMKFARVQFTPDLMPADVIGTSVYNQATREFEFKPGPVFANLVLIDEINRAPAKTQAALFEVMEERQITVDGTTYHLEPPFLVLATQNPVEQEGTYRLPEAQLDRFLFLAEVNYPNLEEEIEILEGHHNRQGKHGISQLRKVLTASQLKQLQEKVQQVRVDRTIMGYIARLVEATRHDPALYLGASPRASLSILNSSKAYAAMDGRDYVTPDDVQKVAYPVIRHRIMLAPEREMDGLRPKNVVSRLIENLEVPR